MDDEVVDHHGRPSFERANEGQAVLGIESAVAAVDAVRDRVLADTHVDRAHAHDLLERAVRVDEPPLRGGSDPDSTRQIVRDGGYERELLRGSRDGASLRERPSQITPRQIVVDHHRIASPRPGAKGYDGPVASP
jgi:hypothetical protein